MFDNKTIWIIGIILIIVVFLGSSSLGRLTAQAAQSTGIGNTVNAHACKADDVCEVNDLSDQNTLWTNNGDVFIGAPQNVPPGVVPALFVYRKPSGGNSWGQIGIGREPSGVNQLLQVGDIGVSQIDLIDNIDPLNVYGQITYGGFSNPDGVWIRALGDSVLGFQSGSIDLARFDLDGNFTVNNLQGNSNAFVCVNAGGTLYRSYNPCR